MVCKRITWTLASGNSLSIWEQSILSHTEGKLGTQQAIWPKPGSAGMMRNRDHPNLKHQALSRVTVHMLFHKGVHSRKTRDSHFWDGSIILTPNIFLRIILVYLWRGFKYDPLKKNNPSSIKMKSIFFSEYHTQYSPVFLLYSILQF